MCTAIRITDEAAALQSPRIVSIPPLAPRLRFFNHLSMPDPFPFRIGHGYDIHPLQSGGRLMVGGVAVSEEMSAVAHSDGDVLIHALVDAMLGAIGGGDIGEMFPNTDPRWKGAESRVFLELVVARVHAEGYRIVNADATILAEQPKMKPFKNEMVKQLTQLLGGTVNIKAGTNERCDAIGRGEAIACHVVVLLGR
jgi:2-C-methyl-D-erythritol 2,4-cyclodiphosphate synthase